MKKFISKTKVLLLICIIMCISESVFSVNNINVSTFGILNYVAYEPLFSLHEKFSDN